MTMHDMGYRAPSSRSERPIPMPPVVYDPDILKSVCGDNPEVIERLLRCFDQVLVRDLRELESAIIRRNTVDIRYQAHRIMDAASSVGAAELAEAVKRIGVSIRTKDWSSMSADLQDVGSAADRLKSRLSRHRV